MQAEVDGDFEIKDAFPLVKGYNTHLKDALVHARWLGPVCSPGDNAGDMCTNISSAYGAISLGRKEDGKSAGRLSFHLEDLDQDSYLPHRLRLHGNDDAEVIRAPIDPPEPGEPVENEGAIRQVLVPEALVEIKPFSEPNSGNGYEIRFYDPAAITGRDPSGWFYSLEPLNPLDPEPEPFVIITVENPDGDTATDRLRLTRVHQNEVDVQEFSLDQNPQKWTLTEGDGARVTTQTTEIVNGDQVVTTIVKNDLNEIASHEVETFQDYGWGWVRVSRVLEPLGVARTTTWSYYTDPGADGDNYGYVKLRTDPGGTWTRYEYDSYGEVRRETRQFLNSSPGDPDADHRVKVTTRNEPDVDSSSNNVTVSTTIEYLLDEEIARSYRVSWDEPVVLGGNSYQKTRAVTATAVGADWEAAENLYTETLTYLSGAGESKPYRVRHLNGTISLYDYSVDSNGERETVTKTGTPNFTLDDVTDGLRTVVRTDSLGNVLEREIYDIASNLMIDWQVTVAQDTFGRPTIIEYPLQHSAGMQDAVETRDYSTCSCSPGTHISVDGIVTSKQFDSLGRVREVTQNGITTIYTYDAANRVVKTERRGTDNTVMTLEERVYNLAGELISVTDAVNETTTHSRTFSGGYIVDTTTFPDLETRIEKRYPDGALYKVEGTAAHPVQYEYGIEAPLGLETPHPFVKTIRVNFDGQRLYWMNGRKFIRTWPGESFEPIPPMANWPAI